MAAKYVKIIKIYFKKLIAQDIEGDNTAFAGNEVSYAYLPYSFYKFGNIFSGSVICLHNLVLVYYRGCHY